MFILVQNAGTVTITNDGHTVDCSPSDAHFTDVSSRDVTVNGGTGLYRVLNMPGVPMPSNRAGLATLIWEKAGCPEPESLKSFDDIDDSDLHLRQAASWMEEQELMGNVKGSEFRPYSRVTKLHTCLIWDKAKEKGLIS